MKLLLFPFVLSAQQKADSSEVKSVVRYECLLGGGFVEFESQRFGLNKGEAIAAKKISAEGRVLWTNLNGSAEGGTFLFSECMEAEKAPRPDLQRCTKSV